MDKNSATTIEFPYYSGTREMTIAEASEHYGIHPATLYKRYISGWSPEEMIKPVRKAKRPPAKTYNFGNGQRLNLKTASKRFDIPYDTLVHRIRAGWKPQEAATKPVRKRTTRRTMVKES